MRIPYTTKTGLQIGIRYQPPKQGMNRDEELIQSALIGSTGKQLQLWVICVISMAAFLGVIFVAGVYK